MIEVQYINDYTLITISDSQANLQNAEMFRIEVLKVLDTRNKNLIIDFSNVAYVDSTFLSVLVAILKAAMKEGGDVAIF